MIGLHKRKTPVREITDHRRDRNAEAVRQNGRHVRAVHQREHQHRAQRHHPAIDDIAAEILAENVSASLEDEQFVANIGVGDRQNIGWNQLNQIMHMRSQQTVKRRVHPHAEHRVPAADDKIPEELKIVYHSFLTTDNTNATDNPLHFTTRFQCKLAYLKFTSKASRRPVRAK